MNLIIIIVVDIYESVVDGGRQKTRILRRRRMRNIEQPLLQDQLISRDGVDSKAIAIKTTCEYLMLGYR